MWFARIPEVKKAVRSGVALVGAVLLVGVFALRTDDKNTPVNAETNSPQTASSTGDPYEAGQRALKAQSNMSQRSALLAKARQIYFAATCKVLPYPDLASAIVNGEALVYLQQVNGAAINTNDENLQNDIEAAERAGSELGQQPDACEYWKTNPEAVAAMRREAGLILQVR